MCTDAWRWTLAVVVSPCGTSPLPWCLYRELKPSKEGLLNGFFLSSLPLYHTASKMISCTALPRWSPFRVLSLWSQLHCTYPALDLCFHSQTLQLTPALGSTFSRCPLAHMALPPPLPMAGYLTLVSSLRKHHLRGLPNNSTEKPPHHLHPVSHNTLIVSFRVPVKLFVCLLLINVLFLIKM